MAKAKGKALKAKIKLQITGGQATPAPPVGPALGQHGVPIGDFVKQFNDRTQESRGTVIPVEISVYEDRSFDFILKSPPAAVLLKKAAGVAKGASNVGSEIVGSVTREQVMEIVNAKREDLRIFSDEAGFKVISGTARSIGLTVEE